MNILTEHINNSIPYGYNSSDGFHWSDTDSDGIPDVVESMLSNSSYFWAFYNFTHKQDWMKEEREKLWNEYNWSIAYYLSLKLNRSYAVIVSNIKENASKYISQYIKAAPHNASCGENTTKYLTSQFNPYIVENMLPVMVLFKVNARGGKLYWHFVIRDAGKIFSSRLQPPPKGKIK